MCLALLLLRQEPQDVLIAAVLGFLSLVNRRRFNRKGRKNKYYESYYNKKNNQRHIFSVIFEQHSERKYLFCPRLFHKKSNCSGLLKCLEQIKICNFRPKRFFQCYGWGH